MTTHRWMDELAAMDPHKGMLLLLLLSHFSRVRLWATPQMAALDSSPPGSPVPGTLQARILEWVPISFSNA